MSLTTILSEIWRFLKDNLVKIFIGALIIAVFAILSGLFLPNLLEQSTEEQIPEEEQIANISDETIRESREYLTNVYDQSPAEFEFFVQLEDGNVFINSFIFDEYFTSPAIVKEIEKITGIEYSQTLAHERNLGLYKTSQYRGSIASIRDTSSNVITVRVQAAENAEDNLILAEAFARLIENNQIPFTEDLKVTWIRTPSIGERLVENNLQMVSSPASLGSFSPAESDSNSVVLYGVAGFILGLIITTILLFIIQLFKNKIIYAFQYSWGFNDQHILHPSEPADKNDTLIDLILYPKVKNRMIVAQESQFSKELMMENEKLENISVIPRISLKTDKPDEIILLIESEVTDKKWFTNQYQKAELYKTQITIVHIVK